MSSEKVVSTCRWCSAAHSNERCPRVKSIEYYPDGSIRKVEFVASYSAVAVTHPQEVVPSVWPLYPGPIWQYLRTQTPTARYGSPWVPNGYASTTPFYPGFTSYPGS